MISKTLADVTEADLISLISNAVPEGKTIDYKQTLPGNSDADKKEFLADVSSFSNTSGGDLIFGVVEAQGLPTQIVGITTADVDLELRRLDSVIADGLEPRIRYTTKVVNCANNARVVIVRSERSWVGPHRVIFRGHDKFYGRNSAGKYPLDVSELRTAFTLSATVTERIAAFRTDRIIAISNNQTPVPFITGSKIVLHCLPLEAFASRQQYDVLQYYKNPQRLRPMHSSGWSWLINLDGVICYSGHDEAHTYIQLYRSGIIESVEASMLSEFGGKRFIPTGLFEPEIANHLSYCFSILEELGCSGPVVVALTLTNARGLVLSEDIRPSFRTAGHAIDLDTVILPEIVVEDMSIPATTILKPTFDLVWNACGYPGSANFDAAGNWAPRR